MAFPYEGLFAQLPTWGTLTGNGAQRKICCPFHQEKTPSFSINLETGEWYCFGFCDEGGGPQELVERLGLQPVAGMEEKKTTSVRKRKKQAPPIPAPKVEEFHKRLVDQPEQLAIFEQTCGISRSTVERFKIGWTGKRYVFPVYDETGHCRNLRLYLYGGDSSNKIYHYSEGEGEDKTTWGGTRLFPLQAILESKDDYVLLCEGEKDALNACQLGFPAVSVTGGAGSWETSLNTFFKNKYVFICYDIDEKGQKGAEKIRRALNKVAKGVAILSLPTEGLPDNGDLTDWIRAGASRDDIAGLIADARGQFERRDKPTRIDTLGAANAPIYNDRLIEVEAHVVGRETTAYTALRGQKLTCPQSKGKACYGCALNDNEGEMQIVVPPDSKEIMYLVERSDKQIRSKIEDQFGLAPCNLWEAEPNLEHKSLVEKVLLSTTVDQRTWGDDGAASEFSQQLAYVVDTRLESNLAYTLVGRMVTHPDDQSNRLIVTQARSTRLSLDTFEVTPELHERLQFFQPGSPDPEAIIARLQTRWDDLAANVTRILRRPNVHAAADLVSHSLLRFSAWGVPLTRAWVEGYVGGDTRQGKSVVAQSLHSHYRAGEFAVLEVASLAGILGGAQKIGNGEFMVSWGKAPLNDRGWVTWDECQNIPLTVMASLSGMRSSGIAELDKIKQEKVFARTRQLWLSNPRQDGVTVDQISQGVLLVPDVFGRPEDQARLDFATIVRSNDVDVYDALRTTAAGAIEHTHTSELCHALLMFAWSRSPQQIKFTPPAENEALRLAESLSKKYDGSIPIVEPAEQRIKLARIAGSVAALCYSTLDGEYLLIKPEHVVAAAKILQWFLDDPACGYDDYSSAAKRANSLDDRDGLIKWCKRQSQETLLGLLAGPDIRRIDIENYSGLDRDHAQTMFTYLLQRRAIVRNGQTYVKSRSFVSLLKEAVQKKWFVDPSIRNTETSRGSGQKQTDPATEY